MGPSVHTHAYQIRISVTFLAQPEVDGAVEKTNPDIPLVEGVICGHEFAAETWPWIMSLQVLFAFLNADL